MARCPATYELAFDTDVTLTCGLTHGHGLHQPITLHHDEIQDVDWREPPNSGVGVTVLTVPPKKEMAEIVS